MLSFMAATVLLSTSCREKKVYVIGVSQCSEDSWRSKVNDEMLASTYLHDNVAIRFASANDNDSLQIRQIDNFVREKVDLLIVSPNQMSTVTEAVNRAYDSGIPVVMLDRKTRGGRYTAFIGGDNFKAGHDIGAYMARLLKGKGNVVEMTGLEGSSAAIERHKGFVSALSRYPGIKIVAQCHSDWLLKPAQWQMDSLLRAGVQPDAVFGQNDRMAAGARNAVEQRQPGRRVLYFGIDALPGPGGGLENVRDGRLDASYIYPTRGDLVIGLAMDILQGRAYKKNNLVEGALVTGHNAEVMLLQNEEMRLQRGQLDTLHGRVNSYLAQYSHQRVYGLMLVVIIVLLVVAFALVVRTLRLKRRMEDKATAAKLVFFTNVSHEFRTPLTLIADPIDRLKSDPTLSENQRSLLRVASKNVEVMLRLVDDLLDFRKVENGKASLVLSRFCMEESIREWTDIFSVTADNRHISLGVDIDGSAAGRFATADREKVAHIFFNLMANAMKYTPDGGSVKVSLSWKNGRFSIVVADSGKGIAGKDIAHLFDRFWQADGSVGGTGIGLALVKAYVDLHHGSVSVQSTPGKGTAFTVSIPDTAKGEVGKGVQFSDDSLADALADDTDQPDDSPTARNAQIITADQSADDDLPTVLVVDDNASMRLYLRSVLRQHYRVLDAPDGGAALDVALKEVPSIVVCDVMMPVMDGMEFCRRLKDNTATSHIPVILLTARSQTVQRAEGYDSGADSYLTKPFSAGVLLARIDNLLRSRRMLRHLFASDRAETEETAQLGSRDREFVEHLRTYVNASMGDSSLSVEQIGAEMGLSRVQLYRKVKALTGMSPIELLRKTRLTHGRRLLADKSKTVAEVAYEVGFTSPSYFSKCFKDEFGVSPADVAGK